MVRLTDRPDMALNVYRGRKTTQQQRQWICRRTANRVVIDGLTHKQFANVSRTFPPENKILRAFVSIYQLYLRLSADVL